jgi:hypothetical protein
VLARRSRTSQTKRNATKQQKLEQQQRTTQEGKEEQQAQKKNLVAVATSTDKEETKSHEPSAGTSKILASSSQTSSSTSAATATTEPTQIHGKTLVMLVSEGFGNAQQTANQERSLMILKSRQIVPALVDGTDLANKELRNRLFGISGIRGKYPQFFLKKDVGGEYSFVGSFDVVESYNDSGSFHEIFGPVEADVSNENEASKANEQKVIETKSQQPEVAAAKNSKAILSATTEQEPKTKSDLLSGSMEQHEPKVVHQSLGVGDELDKTMTAVKKASFFWGVEIETTKVAMGVLALSVTLGAWLATRQ